MQTRPRKRTCNKLKNKNTLTKYSRICKWWRMVDKVHWSEREKQATWNLRLPLETSSLKTCWLRANRTCWRRWSRSTRWTIASTCMVTTQTSFKTIILWTSLILSGTISIRLMQHLIVLKNWQLKSVLMRAVVEPKAYYMIVFVREMLVKAKLRPKNSWESI